MRVLASCLTGGAPSAANASRPGPLACAAVYTRLDAGVAELRQCQRRADVPSGVQPRPGV